MKKISVTYFIKDEYDKQEFDAANDSVKFLKVLSNIDDQLFRPAFKHGYPDRSMQEILEYAEEKKYTYLSEDGEEYNIVYEAIDKLRKMFWELMEEEGVDLDRYGW